VFVTTCSRKLMGFGIAADVAEGKDEFTARNAIAIFGHMNVRSTPGFAWLKLPRVRDEAGGLNSGLVFKDACETDG